MFTNSYLLNNDHICYRYIAIFTLNCFSFALYFFFLPTMELKTALKSILEKVKSNETQALELMRVIQSTMKKCFTTKKLWKCLHMPRGYILIFV